jgi:hypothetical protein
VADRYGEDALQAFGEVKPLSMPIVLESLQTQRAEVLEDDLVAAKKRLAYLEAQKELTAAEREELEVFRQQKKLRAAAGRSAKRAQSSRPKRKRKRGR